MAQADAWRLRVKRLTNGSGDNENTYRYSHATQLPLACDNGSILT
jgi:hypothetical protein